MNTTVYDPRDFADEQFAVEHAAVFDKYVQLRVMGTSRDLAVVEALEMVRLGINTDNARHLAFAFEQNPYVRRRFTKVLESKDVKVELWSERKAVHRLLEIIEDPCVRESTRLNAIVQLNVLCGYIQLDDGMSRRIGHSLADFAKLNSDFKKPAKMSDDDVPVNGHDARAVH